MSQDKDERKRSHLRLVVNNPEKRGSRPAQQEEVFMSLEQLVTLRDGIRPDFYRGLSPWHVKAYETLEKYLAKRGWAYGLDPHHGRLIVLPTAAVCPDSLDLGGSPNEEVLMFISEDVSGQGLCLSLEMIMPFWSEEESVMEDALLFGPIHQYGMLFLEENRQDGFLDLLYRLAFPLYPPALSGKLLDKFFAIIEFELRETLRSLIEYPEG